MVWRNRFLIVFFFTIAWFVLGRNAAESATPVIPYPKINTAVIHSGKYDVLSAGKTFVILDRTRGLSISAIGLAESSEEVTNPANAAMEEMSLRVSTKNGTVIREMDQANSPDATLRIIAQAPDYAAARAFFSICEADGVPRGNGTLDIYVLPGRVFLIPSLSLESEPGGVTVTMAEFYGRASGKSARMEVNGAPVQSREQSHFVRFGGDTDGFQVMIQAPGHPAAILGWLRNRYPEWMYLNEIDTNPETDELYEKWPPWITQRGALTWKPTESSGFLTDNSEDGQKQMAFLWVNRESYPVPEGRYSRFNGVMGIFLDQNPERLRQSWNSHERPLKPVMQSGDFRYYSEFEGAYEINSHGGDVDLTFDSPAEDRPIFARIWDLQGKGGYEVRVNGQPAPFGLMNDGDLVEDPLVSIDHDVLQATGPARTATVSFTARKGVKTRLTLTRKPGIQLTYQMYSNLERYEAWSDACADKPLFSIYIKNGNIYNAMIPRGEDYAFYMYNLYWPGSPRPSRAMNNVRGFTVFENGPERLRFRFDGIEPLGTALSSFTVTVPYERERLTLGVNAKFTPESDGKRWTSFEICNVYPFDTVYRRNFHFKDFVFLTKDGVFDRMGPGAWGSRINRVDEPGGLGYYAKSERRSGPGTHTPGGEDGSVWIFCNSKNRGNVLFRRGDCNLSPGAVIRLGMCNAWVDVNNNLNRKDLTAVEEINYTLEIFGGSVPPVNELNALYRKSAGGSQVKKITKVVYDRNSIGGFVTE
ncbi:MAG: hypothetical protein ACYC9O_04245 [Candidatus Latescibacterota bacterium]